MVRDGGIQHYYTLFGKDKGQVVIGDPDPSKNVIKLSLEDFDKRYLVFFRFYQFISS